MASRPMRVATPDPVTIGDRRSGGDDELGRAAVARPPAADHISPRGLRCVGDRVALPNRSESRPSQVMQALSERYRPFSRDRHRRDAVARAAVIERRRATSCLPISHRIGEKPKVLKRFLSEIGVKSDSWPPAGVGRPPMRSAGLMPESNLEKSLSAKALPSEFGIAI